ncbi:hypothetical protein BJV77DRAFT_1020949 [Russula vinacea]|nr:hypothetical protein BJV77DRAFT_1020949 [Russula vinacea]
MTSGRRSSIISASQKLSVTSCSPARVSRTSSTPILLCCVPGIASRLLRGVHGSLTPRIGRSSIRTGENSSTTPCYQAYQVLSIDASPVNR